MVIKRRIKKSGNSLVLTIDSLLREILEVSKDEIVNVEIQDGKVIITKGDVENGKEKIS